MPLHWCLTELLTLQLLPRESIICWLFSICSCPHNFSKNWKTTFRFKSYWEESDQEIAQASSPRKSDHTHKKKVKKLTSFLTISEGNACLEITHSARVRVFLSEVFTATLFTIESKLCISVAESRRHSTQILFMQFQSASSQVSGHFAQLTLLKIHSTTSPNGHDLNIIFWQFLEISLKIN